MKVEIPSITQHAGMPTNIMVVTIEDKCPTCGGKRGAPKKGISWDGSRRLWVDCWTNPCGHIDSYADVRKEYHEQQTKLS